MAVAQVEMRPDGLNKGGLEEKSAWLGQPGRTPAADAGNKKLAERACYCGGNNFMPSHGECQYAAMQYFYRPCFPAALESQEQY
jgi:hypothetical protein